MYRVKSVDILSNNYFLRISPCGITFEIPKSFDSSSSRIFQHENRVNCDHSTGTNSFLKLDFF